MIGRNKAAQTRMLCRCLLRALRGPASARCKCVAGQAVAREVAGICDDRRRHHTGGEVLVVELLIKVLVNAAALWAAVQLIPQITFNFGQDWWKLLVVALIFALINTYLKPIVKALSFPISLLTLGLIGFVINAAMLLLTAALSDQFKLGFKVGGFPPSITADAIIGAVLGAIVISIVSTLLSLALAPRKLL
jgi:putative membrane protein